MHALLAPVECEEFLGAYTVWLDELERVITLAEDLEAIGYEPTAEEFSAWTEFHTEHVEAVPMEPLSGCGPQVLREHPDLATSIVWADERLWRLVKRQEEAGTWFRRAALATSLST